MIKLDDNRHGQAACLNDSTYDREIASAARVISTSA